MRPLPVRSLALRGRRGRQVPLHPPSPHLQVVVVGGGFAGMAAVRAIRDQRMQVTLVDPVGAQVFQPLLYQVATGLLEPEDVVREHAESLQGRHNVHPVTATVVGFDVRRRRVRLRGSDGSAGNLPYDVLIVAAGGSDDSGYRAERAPSALGLTTVEDAVRMRSMLLAPGAASPSTVVVGGGPTGVELAGRAAELLRDVPGGTVTLLESGPDVLPTYPRVLRAAARHELRRAGVDVRTDASVHYVDGRTVVLADGVVSADAVLWAGGTVAAPVVAALAEATGAEVDGRGRIVVGADLTVPGHPDVVVVGDAASVPGVPAVAAAAMQMGRHAARVVEARAAGRETPRFRFFDKGEMAVVTRRSAVARLGPGPLPLWGPAARALWSAVHLWYLPGNANRRSVAAAWALPVRAAAGVVRARRGGNPARAPGHGARD